MPEPTRATVVTDDGAHLAVYTDGDPHAAVTVVLSHGYLMTAGTWRLQTRSLAASGYRVVRYDQRAHGHSSPGEEPASVERLGADLAHVITAASPRGPIVLAGHSLGGMALLSLAVRDPHLVLDRRPRIALISTSCTRAAFAPGYSPRHWAKAVARAAYAYPICWLPAAADQVRRRLSVKNCWALRPDGTRPLASPPPCRQAIHRTPTKPVGDLWRSLRAHDLRGALHGVADLHDRVEILTGELDDMIPLAQTQQLARELPNARLHTPVPRAGHRLPSDKHGHAAVTALLARLCAASQPAPLSLRAIA